MRGALIYAPGDIRVEERKVPTLEASTDAVIKVTAACVCGSDLHPYRGVEPVDGPAPIGHEYVGVVEQIGEEVKTSRSATSSLVRSWLQTTHVRSARTVTSPVAYTGSLSEPAGRRPNSFGSPLPMARWSRLLGSLKKT